jgi:hypothetical protein
MAANLKIIKKLHFISIFLSSFCAELIFGGNKGGFLQTLKKSITSNTGASFLRLTPYFLNAKKILFLLA